MFLFLPRLFRGGQALRDLVLLAIVVFIVADRALPAIRAQANEGEPVSAASGPQTAFSYQGRLIEDGLPVDGQYDLTFRLWDAAANGNLLATDGPATGVAVANGLFATIVDFEMSTSDGTPRWIEVLAKATGAAADPVSLGRLPLLAAPHDHLFQSWTGDGPTAALSLTNEGAGNALSLESTTATALQAQSASTDATIRGINTLAGGRAVQGDASLGNGVVGTSSAPGFAASAGVHGGTGCGVGTPCIGVFGTTTSPSGIPSVGVLGEVNAFFPSSAGVEARNPAGTALRATGHHGGFFQGNAGDGVQAYSIERDGVYGYSEGAGGSGVYGQHFLLGGSNCSGLTVMEPDIPCAGVRGLSLSANGAGVAGSGQYGVVGYGNHGVFGQSRERGFSGVFGRSYDASCGTATPADHCYGVIGDGTLSPANAGVGVMGIGSFAGIWGRSHNGRPAAIFSGPVIVNGVELQTSDVRLKKDISDLQPGLAEVLRLRPVTYTWNTDDFVDDSPHLGFIAQEVQEVLPGIVSESVDDHLAIATLELIPVLVNAIQEQQEQIDDLSGYSSAPASTPGIRWPVLFGVIGACAAAGFAGARAAQSIGGRRARPIEPANA